MGHWWRNTTCLCQQQPSHASSPSSSALQPQWSQAAAAAGTGAEAEERTRGSIEGVINEDDLRRVLASSILHRNSLPSTTFAFFAKQWAKNRTGGELTTPASNFLEAVTRRASCLARGIYGGGTGLVEWTAGKEYGDESSDFDPGKKSGPGKVMEEGTTSRSCGEEGEGVGWSEEEVEWCGMRYARGDLPAFDTTGLRDKMAYNPNHALWLATASALAYRSPPQIRHVVTRIWMCEYMTFFHSAPTDTQGFGMFGQDCIVISFRGTECRRDMFTSTKVRKVEAFPDLPHVKVHRGFNMSLLSIWDQIVSFLHKARSANPDLPLFITGHSLGGALANLCLAYLTFLSPNPLPRWSLDAHERQIVSLGVYTFGQPKVGNREFAAELRARAAGTVFFRLTNDNDFIPFLPKRPSYVHCGKRLFLSHGHLIVEGGVDPNFARHLCRKTSSRRMMKRKQQGLRDHFIRSYVAFLWDHYRRNAIILASARKDVPLLHFHDMERAARLRDELESLGDFESVMQRLRELTLSELIDLRSITVPAKQRKRENRALGSKWFRNNLWDLLEYSEKQQMIKINQMLGAAADTSAPLTTIENVPR